MHADPSIPWMVALAASLETTRQVVAAMASCLSSADAKFVDMALEQGAAALSSGKAAETDLSDVHLRAHVKARNEFRKLIAAYRGSAKQQTENG